MVKKKAGRGPGNVYHCSCYQTCTNKAYFERLTEEGNKFEKKPKVSMQVTVKADRNHFARL